MSLSDTTPGPWTTKPGVFFVTQVGGNIGDPGVWSEAVPPSGIPFPFGDKAADARLISAAPELYAALKWFIDDIDSTRTVMIDFDANVERARAALAKAEGRQ